MCISTQQLVRMFDGGDWDKSYSSGIWDGNNDSTIGNEMVSEWTDSGKWDGRKSVKVGNGNGMGSEGQIVAREESGTGKIYLAVGWETRESNGRGRETSVGKGNIATVPVPVPSRPLFPSSLLPREALKFCFDFLLRDRMDRSFSFESSPSRTGEVDDNVRIQALFLKITFVFRLTKILLWVLTRFKYLRIFL